MSGMQRNQRRVPQSRALLTSLLTSLASSTLSGSHWELSCSRAATSHHGKRWKWSRWDKLSVFVNAWVRKTKYVSETVQNVGIVLECCSIRLWWFRLLTMWINPSNTFLAFTKLYWNSKHTVYYRCLRITRKTHKTQKWEENTCTQSSGHVYMGAVC